MSVIMGVVISDDGRYTLPVYIMLSRGEDSGVVSPGGDI